MGDIKTVGKYTEIKKVKNTDQWHNIHDGTGQKGRDRKVDTSHQLGKILDQAELESIYMCDGIGSRIVTALVDECTNKWITIKNDVDNVILNYVNTLKTEKSLNEAFRWSRLYGGSIIMMLIDDGGDLEEEVRPNNIKKVLGLKVYDRHQVNVNSIADYYDDPSDIRFGDARIYTVIPRKRGVAFNEFRVHESRVLKLTGLILSPSMAGNYDFDEWGASELQVTYEQLKNSGSIQNEVVDIIKQFVINVMQVKNYLSMVQHNEIEQFYNRLNFLDMSMRMNNTMFIDEKESMQRIVSNVSGLSDLIDRYMESLAAAADIPVSILLKRPPKGLGSGEQSGADLEQWYGKCEKAQKDKLLEPLKKLVEYVMLSKEGPTKGKILDGWEIVFNPLQVKTEEQNIANMKNMSETDKNYIEQGVITAEEVRESRFGGDNYSIQTKIVG